MLCGMRQPKAVATDLGAVVALLAVAMSPSHWRGLNSSVASACEIHLPLLGPSLGKAPKFLRGLHVPLGSSMAPVCGLGLVLKNMPGSDELRSPGMRDMRIGFGNVW